jgi:hypothetical protein
METNTEYGEDSIETISQDILIGLGCNTEANHDYLYLRLVELVSYVTELAAEKAADRVLEVQGIKSGPIEADRDNIEL